MFGGSTGQQDITSATSNSPGYALLSFLVLRRLETAAKSGTSAAKAARCSEAYGTAEAVPFVDKIFPNDCTEREARAKPQTFDRQRR
jgi:hypothetical protein